MLNKFQEEKVRKQNYTFIMTKHDIQKESRSQTRKEITVLHSLNDEITARSIFFCIFQVFSKIFISPRRKRNYLR